MQLPLRGLAGEHALELLDPAGLGGLLGAFQQGLGPGDPAAHDGPVAADHPVQVAEGAGDPGRAGGVVAVAERRVGPLERVDGGVVVVLEVGRLGQAGEHRPALLDLERAAVRGPSGRGIALPERRPTGGHQLDDRLVRHLVSLTSHASRFDVAMLTRLGRSLTASAASRAGRSSRAARTEKPAAPHEVANSAKSRIDETRLPHRTDGAQRSAADLGQLAVVEHDMREREALLHGGRDLGEVLAEAAIAEIDTTLRAETRAPHRH